MMLLMSSCGKRVLLMEERIIDPKAAACVCPTMPLDHFLLVGDQTYARMVKQLEYCRARKYIEKAME